MYFCTFVFPQKWPFFFFSLFFSSKNEINILQYNYNHARFFEAWKLKSYDWMYNQSPDAAKCDK